jgi:hypothetical protein
MNSLGKFRGSSGVVLSLHTLENGQTRIVLDDVDSTDGTTDGGWKHRTLVTFKDYENLTLDDLQLSEEEFAAFGHYVMVRLLACDTSAT